MIERFVEHTVLVLFDVELDEYAPPPLLHVAWGSVGIISGPNNLDIVRANTAHLTVASLNCRNHCFLLGTTVSTTRLNTICYFLSAKYLSKPANAGSVATVRISFQRCFLGGFASMLMAPS